MKHIRYNLAFAALVPLLFPLNAWTANPAPLKAAAIKTNADIALTRDNALSGRLVDETGKPVNGMPVAIYSQGHMTAATVSNQAGDFSLVTNRGGVYELHVGDQFQIVRLWHHDTAPPSAESAILLRVGQETVRGQRPIKSLFCFQPWFLGALVAAAIAIPIAVNDSDSRPAVSYRLHSHFRDFKRAQMHFGLTTVKLSKQKTTIRFRPGFLYAIGLVCMFSGCRQVGISPSSLPAEYAAQPAIQVSSLDLSRLSSSQANGSTIYPGDMLNVTVATGAEARQPTPWPVTVAEDGTVEVPLVGPVRVAGLDVRQAQGLIRDAGIHRGIYRQPSVSMSLESRRTNRISVVGGVDKPGSYELPVAGSDLLSALIAAGGLSKDADRIVEIRLPAPAVSPHGNGQTPMEVARTSYNGSPGQHPQPLGPRSVRLDLVAATTSPQPRDYRLGDGAIVMVRKLPPRYVHVIGLVQKPNRFELPPGENIRILDAIAMAQGLKISIADRAYVIRQIPNATEPVVIEVSIRRAKTTPADNILLTDGDVVSVEETPLTFVTGTLKNVVRIGLSSSLSLF